MSPRGGLLAALGERWYLDVALPVTSPGRGRAIGRALHRLEHGAPADREALEALTTAKLASLLDHASTRVPFYAPEARTARGAGDAGAAATDHAALRGWPLLARHEVQAAGDALLSRDPTHRPVTWQSTGGSTGQPLRVGKDLATIAMSEALVLRARRWVGVPPGARGVLLSTTGRVTVRGALRSRLLNLTPRVALPDQVARLRAVAHQLARCAPAFLAGYPSALLSLEPLARVVGARVPVIFTTGEMLDPVDRGRLADTFGARVFDAYGSNEIGGLAFECERGRLHVSEEHVVLEAVDDDGRPVWDAPGRLVVTDLDNRAMPLVRYLLGDVAVLTRQPCPCGRPHRVLTRLEGRVQDVLRSPDGRRLPAIWFGGAFRELRDVLSVQVEQLALDRVELRFVPGGPDALREVEGVAAAIRERLGDGVHVAVVERDAIPLTARGKARPVIGLRPEAP